MLILAKAILAMMIGFVIAVFFGLVLIPILKKVKIKQTLSVFLTKNHKSKEGTPTMGGLIFIIPTILTMIYLLITDKVDNSSNLFLVLFVFLGYAMLGFIDDYLIIKRNNNEGLTEFQKLVGQLIISLVFFYLYMSFGNNPIIDIHMFNLEIHLGPLYGIFLLLVLIATSNAVNITDGLDGLAGGLSLISFLALGIISWGSTGILGYEGIAIFCFVLVGSLLGFLVYNAYPAKVFMGDTGSLALGAAMAAVAIITRHEITLIIVAGVFVIETLTCIIQMIAGRYFGKKIFLMAPLHHHFEKLGWKEYDIVRMFYIVGLLLTMSAICFGVWI
ncbi:MAG: phospho-N-acetylmuramoyl-pentapeptide-transferase [Mycoplasmatota bacterium]